MEIKEFKEMFDNFLRTNADWQKLEQIQKEEDYRVEIISNPEDTEPKVKVTPRQKIVRKQGAGIRLTFENGETQDFINGTLEALLFVVERVGYEECHRYYPAGIKDEQPANISSVVEKTDDNGKTWYILKNEGIDNRVKNLNKVFEKSGNCWKAERI